jgi:hypothetical protein
MPARVVPGGKLLPKVRHAGAQTVARPAPRRTYVHWKAACALPLYVRQLQVNDAGHVEAEVAVKNTAVRAAVPHDLGDGGRCEKRPETIHERRLPLHVEEVYMRPRAVGLGEGSACQVSVEDNVDQTRVQKAAGLHSSRTPIAGASNEQRPQGKIFARHTPHLWHRGCLRSSAGSPALGVENHNAAATMGGHNQGRCGKVRHHLVSEAFAGAARGGAGRLEAVRCCR